VGLVDLLWRGLAVFRLAALAYAAALIAGGYRGYAHPVWGWLVFGVMVVWTAVTGWAYASPARRRWPLLTADLAVAIGCLAASYPVVGPDAMRTGAATLPMAWVAGAVVAWAIRGGRRLGAVAALAVGATDLAVRGISVTPLTINATVLLLLTAVVMGYVARFAGQAERQLQRAAEREAATRERERLARGIHDSVLQVLALVQRRGAELGGEAAVLGQLAGEQQATLRALVAGDSVEPHDDQVDLRAVLSRYAAPEVTLSTPADPVGLPAPVAAELAAAVGAALDNVKVHCGARTAAWVLVESEPAAVTVTVRDDGPGIPDGRLAEAAAEGRLGVAQSIEGRMRDLGGGAIITSAAGQGTEVELRLPWPA
jgi:signal transduction histidine kinase